MQTYPLATLMKHMLTHSGLIDEFKLSSVHAERRLDRFLVAVDMHYHRPIRNPAEDRVDVKSTQGEEGGDGLQVGYHNVIHACDVLQSTYAYIHLSDLIVNQPCPRFRYEMLWAAMIHDFGHPGVDNDFLVKTESAAAEACEEAPLEHYHSRFGKVVKCEFDAFDYATVVEGHEPGTSRYFRWDDFVPANGDGHGHVQAQRCLAAGARAGGSVGVVAPEQRRAVEGPRPGGEEVERVLRGAQGGGQEPEDGGEPRQLRGWRV